MQLDEVLQTAVRQAAVTAETAHRPWPVPETSWVSAQTWTDVAFLHWRVDERELRRQLPETVELDTFDGSAWLGILAFVVSDVRLRGLLPLPWLVFPELNVRTYVVSDDRPGVWFFSLDAASTLVVEGAKLVYRLPYNRAEMRSERIGEFVHFESARAGAAFSGRYRGDGSLFGAEPGSLDAFLTERYCLYTENGGRGYRAEIHHPPWALQRGEAVVDLDTVAPVPLAGQEPHVLFSPRQDVVVWPLQAL